MAALPLMPTCCGRRWARGAWGRPCRGLGSRSPAGCAGGRELRSVAAVPARGGAISEAALQPSSCAKRIPAFPGGLRCWLRKPFTLHYVPVYILAVPLWFCFYIELFNFSLNESHMQRVGKPIYCVGLSHCPETFPRCPAKTYKSERLRVTDHLIFPTVEHPLGAQKG